MIYFVGGASRAGKSAFAKVLRRETGAQAIAGDAFRVMIRFGQMAYEAAQVAAHQVYKKQSRKG